MKMRLADVLDKTRYVIQEIQKFIWKSKESTTEEKAGEKVSKTFDQIPYTLINLTFNLKKIN